tara:strand:- start:16 stop:342 length:327 start_codon:yes stop_codon:yes gene_type:complete
MVKIAIATKDGGITRDATAEEQAEFNAQIVKDNKERKDNFLNEIKKIRLEKLQETDWWVLRGDITDEQKLYRKNLRDIPSNFSTDEEYESLLAKDEQGQLTHSIWSKP